MRGMPPRLLWHGWEKPPGRAAAGAEVRALTLAAGAALIRLSVPLQRWAGYLPWAVPLGAALMALRLYMDIRHGWKAFASGCTGC